MKVKYKIGDLIGDLILLEEFKSIVKWKSTKYFTVKCSCGDIQIKSLSNLRITKYCWIRWRHKKIIDKWDYFELELTKWKYTKVDTIYYDLIRKHCWIFSNRWYAVASINNKTVKLHTFITWYNFIDHKNRDRLDNRQDNLVDSNSKLNNRNSSNNIMIIYNWKEQCLMDWSIELDINYDALRARLNRNWSIERAFNA